MLRPCLSLWGYEWKWASLIAGRLRWSRVAVLRWGSLCRLDETKRFIWVARGALKEDPGRPDTFIMESYWAQWRWWPVSKAIFDVCVYGPVLARAALSRRLMQTRHGV